MTQNSSTQTVEMTMNLGDFAAQSGNNASYTMALNNEGLLIITFKDGNEIIISKDQDVALKDGTILKGEDLYALVAGESSTSAIIQPADQTAQIIFIEEGTEYAADFDAGTLLGVAETQGAVLISFTNGSQILLVNYQNAITADNAATFNYNGESANILAAISDSIVEQLNAEFAESGNEDDLNAISTSAGDTAEVPTITDSMATPITLEELLEQTEETPNPEAIVAEFDGTEEGAELALIEPAAGEGTGGTGSDGGVSFGSEFNTGFVFDNVSAVGPINETALEFDGTEGEDEQAPADLLNQGTPTPPTPPTRNPLEQPNLRVVDIDGPGGEGNDDSLFEDGSVRLPIEAAPGAGNTGPEYTISVVLSNIPTGVSVDTSQSGGVYDANNGTWTIDVTPGQSLPFGPTITPPADSDLDINDLLVTVTVTDLVTGDTETTSDTFDIIVDAVADTPNFDVNDVTGSEDNDISLDIQASSTDTDGSETVQVLIQGVPSGGSLSAGTFNASLGGWVVDQADLNGLTFTPPQHLSGTVTMTATALVTDNPTDLETDLNNNELQVSETFTVTIAPIADAPSLSIQNASVYEDGSVALNIDAHLVDTDSSETLTVRVEGIPSGWGVDTTQSGGSYDSNTGVWEITLTANQVFNGGPTLTPPANDDQDISLTVTATSTEIADLNQTSTVTRPLNVTVDAVADEVNLTAGNVVGQEDETIDLDVAASLIDTDGSETITEVRISGFPTGTQLSAGSFSNGVWTLSVSDLNGLQATLPNSITGDYTVTVEVDTLDSESDNEITTANNTNTTVKTFGLNSSDDGGPTITNPGGGTVDETNGGGSGGGGLVPPLVVDLDGDGIELLSLDNANVSFDLLDTGSTLQTGWVAPDDGLLAYDADSSGQIENGSELFGHATAENGFAALKLLDSNGDDVIDSSDTAYAQLGVWQDANVDGVTQNGEFVTLANLGIQSIDLSNVTIDFRPVDGNFIGFDSTYSTTNGSGIISDAFFVTDSSTTPSPLVVTGQVIVDFGNDGPGTIVPNGTFTATGSLLSGALTSESDTIAVNVVNGDTYEGTTNNGANTVFTFQINPNTGEYTFTLYDQIDHADAFNANDIANLNFGISAIDNDNDVTNGTVTMNVVDDAPDAVNDSFNESDTSGLVTGNVLSNDDLGFDQPAEVTQVEFNSQTYTMPQSGIVTIIGNYGTLTISADGFYGYTLDENRASGGTDNFTYTVRDNDGDTDTAVLSANIGDADDFPIITPPSTVNVDESNPGVINGNITVDFGRDAPGVISESGNFSTSQAGQLTSNGYPVSVSVVGGQYVGSANGQTVFTLNINNDGSYTFNLIGGLDHSNPNSDNESFDLRFGFTATDDDGDSTTGTLVINVADDAPIAANDTFSLQEDGNNSNGGNVLTNDNNSLDAPETVTQVEFNSQTYNVTAGGITIQGDHGSLLIYANGNYTYTAGNTDGVDTFTYTVVDADGDTDTADIIANVTDKNDVPTITDTGTGPNGYLGVDEAGVKNVSGSLTADVGDDGPANFSETGVFVSSVVFLQSNGQQISVNLVNGQYVGTIDNGQTPVFEFNVNSNGTYSFQQFEQIDHPNAGTDTVDLTFGVRVTDTDGQTDDDSVTIRVTDDLPVAVNDAQNVNEGSQVTGNLLNNDDKGFDNDGADVTHVQYNGQTHVVPVTGSVLIQTANGTLSVSMNGNYTFTQTGNLASNANLNFTYTMRDGDGDTDTADLNLSLIAQDDTPDITGTGGTKTVDESGAHTTSGTVTADFGQDSNGAFFTENGSFSSSMGNNLASNGVAIAVTIQNGKYVGKAGGNTVFELNVESDGDYTFQQFDQIDHPNSNATNEYVDLLFGVRAQDGDGDRDNADIRIRVRDDAPDANNDSNSMDEGQTKSGNLLSNDDAGYDNDGAYLSSVTVDGQTYNFNQNSGDLVKVVKGSDGAEIGVFRVGPDGAYSFQAYNNLSKDYTETISYTLSDGDGDRDSANLTLSLNDTAIPVTNVNSNIGNTQFYEGDGNYKALPISASYAGGDGNEYMVLRVTGIPSGWGVQASGWTNKNGGYERTVNAKNYNSNSFKIRPPQNDSDVDASNIKLKVTVVDQDGPNHSDTDGATAVVDAVVDGAVVDILTANEYQALQSGSSSSSTNYNSTYNNYYNTYYGGASNAYNYNTYQQLYGGREDYYYNGSNYNYYSGYNYSSYNNNTYTGSSSSASSSTYSGYAASNSYNYNNSTWLSFAWGNMNLSGDVLKIDLKDTDGSEVVTKIIISGLYSGGREIGFNVGTKLGAGKWQLSYDEYLNAQFVDVSGNAHSAVYSGNSGFLNGTIYSNFRVDVHIRDNASDQEITNSNNNTVVTVSQELRTYSPLVLDLDGDGVELLPVEGGVEFDLDGDGDLDVTGWVDSDDGLLALDRNADGIINDGTELFGEAIAEHGFAALAVLDTNADGQIDANDADFANLLVWRDMNADGVSQGDELFTLSDLGIASISLQFTEDYYGLDGNFIGYESSYVLEDGTVRDIVDVYFNMQDNDAGDTVVSTEGTLIISNDDVFEDESGNEEVASLLEGASSSSDSSDDIPELDELELSSVLEEENDVQSALDNFIEETGGAEEASVAQGDSEGDEELVVLQHGLSQQELEHLIDSSNSDSDIV